MSASDANLSTQLTMDDDPQLQSLLAQIGQHLLYRNRAMLLESQALAGSPGNIIAAPPTVTPSVLCDVDLPNPPQSASSVAVETISQIPIGTQPTTANWNQHRPTYRRSSGREGVTNDVSPDDPQNFKYYPTPGGPLSPPPPATFTTYTDAHEYITKWAPKKSYKLVILRSADRGSRTTYGCWLHTKKAKSNPSREREEDEVSRTPESPIADANSANGMEPPPVEGSGNGLRRTTPVKRKAASLSMDKGCPFTIKLRRLFDDTWEVSHVSVEFHTHEPVTEIARLAPKFTQEQYDIMTELLAKGRSRTEIRAALEQPDCPADYYTASRVRAAVHRISRGIPPPDMTVIEAVLASIASSDSPWYYSTRFSRGNHLQALFLMHTNAREALKDYWHLLVVDCTYSTNKHGLKLLNVVGRAPTNCSWSVAHCLLDHETVEAFTWALTCIKHLLPKDVVPTFASDRDQAMLNAIKVVFPTAKIVLCTWHVGRAVETAIKTRIVKDCIEQSEEDVQAMQATIKGTFHKLMHSKSAEAETSHWDALQEDRRDHPGIRTFMDYLENVWWPHRDKWVLYRSCTTLCYEIRTTGRVEGAHARLKGLLTGRNNTVNTLKSAFEMLAIREHKLIAAALTKQLLGKRRKDGRPAAQRMFLHRFQNTIGWSALELAGKEISAAHSLGEVRTHEQPCRCFSRVVHGVPCRSFFAMRMQQGSWELSKGDFHPSQHLPQRWPEGGRIPLEERAFDLPGLGDVADFAMELHDKLEHHDAISRSAYLQALRAFGRTSQVGNLLPPVPQTASAALVAHHARHGRANGRMPSAHEVVNARERRQSRHCSRCGAPGHTSANCPAPTPVASQENEPPRTPRLCSSCGAEGHIRSNRLCPNFDPWAADASGSTAGGSQTVSAQAGAAAQAEDSRYNRQFVADDDFGYYVGRAEEISSQAEEIEVTDV